MKIRSIKIFLRELLLASILLCAYIISSAQTDNPCGAPSLTINTTCVFSNANLSSTATATGGVPAPTCGNYSGADVWFTATVPANGILNLNTNPTTGSTDMAMSVYSATACNGTFTQIACDDDSSPNGLMPALQLSGLIPGTTVYIRLWDYGGGSSGPFQICAQSPNSLPPPPPAGCIGGSNNTCPAADPFCTGVAYNYCNTTGVADMGTFQCLTTTPNPMWMYLNIAVAGNIDIYIEQFDNNGSGIDVDFALYGPYGSLASACPITGSTSAIDCSYDPAPTETANIVSASVGEWYILLITNFADDPGYIQFSQTGGLGATNCSIVLPVELAWFTAKCGVDGIILEWATASEINNKSFYIERSSNGLEYVILDTIPGSGTSNFIRNYSWFDRTALPDKDYYYRLKQVDFDGAQKVFAPIYKKCEGNLNSFQLYPNPANESLEINFNADFDEEFTMEIFDISGKLVYQHDYNVEAGRNYLKLNISNFADGYYELRIHSESQFKSFRLMKRTP